MIDLPSIVVPGIVSLVVMGAGYFANRRLGIAPGQQILVKTLQDTVTIMGQKMDVLAEDFKTCKVRLEVLELEKRELDQTVDDLRSDIRKLRSRKP